MKVGYVPIYKDAKRQCVFENCHESFQSKAWNRRYCDVHQNELKLESAFPDIAKYGKSAAAELMVSIDLIQKGYEVFRNISGQGPTIDLLSIKDKQILKIQVKCTTTHPNTLPVLKHPEEIDVIALVNANGIFYKNMKNEFINM